jgi:hypothetical protein
MHVILFPLVCAIASAATVTIDYKCMPNIACGVLTSAMSNKGIGLAGFNDVEFTNTSPLHKGVDKYTCPINYCGRLKDTPPSNFHSCFEYPFSSTTEKHRNNKCVPQSEMRVYQETMREFYSSNNIGNGDAFYVKVNGITPQSCLALYSA